MIKIFGKVGSLIIQFCCCYQAASCTIGGLEEDVARSGETPQ